MALIRDRKRLVVVDAIRALALFGVLVMNLRDMAGLDLLTRQALESLQGPVDRVLEFALQLTLDEKFLSIFSFLFGLSFFLLLERKADRPGFVALYARRLLVLALFGLLNIAFLYWGDILLIYAIYGTSMVLLVRLPQYVLLVIAGLFLLGGPLGLALAGITGNSGSQTAADLATLQNFASTNYWAGVEQGWSLYFSSSAKPNLVEVWDHTNVFGMLVLGLWTGRAHVAHDLDTNVRSLGRLAMYCLPLGLGIEMVRFFLPDTSTVHTLALVGPPILAVGYLAAAATLLNRPQAASLVSLLAAPGRLALTNYLAYGLLGQVLFYGWAFGWIGQVGTAKILAMGILAYVVLLMLSHVWLRFFRMGPFEWLWRCLTYLRVEPLRRSAATAAAEAS